MTELKIMVLVDKLQSELTELKIETILCDKEKLKYKNLKKSIDIFAEYIDDKMKDKKEAFGDLCDSFVMVT